MNISQKPCSDVLSLFAHRLPKRNTCGQQKTEAVAWLEHKGLPDKRVEQWRYTDLRALGRVPYKTALRTYNPYHAEKLLHTLPQWGEILANLPRFVVVNGYFDPVLSQIPQTFTLTTCPFENVSGNGGKGEDLKGIQQPFMALNTALAEEEIFLHVQEGVKVGQVLMVSLTLGDEQPVSLHPRYTLKLDKGAHLSLLSIYAGDGIYCHNPVEQIEIAEHATLKHLTLFQESAQASVLKMVQARVAGRGVYESFILTLGGLLTRHDINVVLAQTGAVAKVNGVQYLSDEQTGDITSVICHEASECISRQTIRNVLSDHARGVFQGKILVKRGAQKTDGYQMSQALLLSEHAEVNVKPELEIYADDVRCSHGATIGALDEEQLFYLRSRGIAEHEARHMLIEAFLSDSLSLLEEEGVVRALCHAVLTRSLDLREEQQS